MSLFNRPAWASSSASKPQESESNLFSHSGRSYGEIVAESEKRKREKKEKEERKQKARAERNSKSPVKHHSDVADEPGSVKKESSFKRRRITSEDSAALLSSVGLSPATAIDNEKDDEERQLLSPKKAAVATRKSPRTTRQRNVREEEEEPESVLSVSQDVRTDLQAEVSEITVVDVAQRDAHDAVQDEESDDEFAELARRARQRQQQQKSHESTGARPIENTSSAPPARDDPPDPVISIFISSPIPDTRQLIVQRKLSQRIQEVREAWCNRQGFTREFADNIFFIHRMHRVYDVTTCRSLGLEVDVFGNLTLRGAEGQEGVDKVHLEAVTEEIYKELREERQRDAQRRSGQLPPEPDPAESGVDEEAGNAEEETLIRIVLKGKDKDDFKLKVKPTTHFSKIMTAYAKFHTQGKPVSLEFDGERLNPDDEVQQSEISDMDCINVYVS